MKISQVTLHNTKQLLSEFDHIKENKTSYAHHQFLWTLFPNITSKKDRQFLFKHLPNNSAPTFIIVSKVPPTDHPAWEVRTKPYSPIINSGDKFEFTLTANPVVTKKNPGKKQSQRCDIVMDWRYNNDRKSKPLSDVVKDEGIKWLSKKGVKKGFSVIQGNAGGYTQKRFFKANSKQSIRISTIDFSGILEVTSSEKFIDTLFNGIGPAKGFGAGLMLIKRTN